MNAPSRFHTSRPRKRFAWEALDGHGRPATGVVEAANAGAARAVLRERGLHAIRLTRIPRERRSHGAAGWWRAWRAAAREREVAAMAAQLATMLRAGIALVPALTLIAQHHASPVFGMALEAVGRDVECGVSLAQALARQPRWFDPLVCALVDAGEQGGILAATLDQIARHQQKSLALRRQVRAALAYPVGVLFVALAVMALLMLVVVPAFKGVFAGFGATLPGPTRTVIAVSDALTAHWPWLLWPPTLLVAGWQIAQRQSEAVRRGRDAALLRLPLLGRLLRRAASARWARTLATLAMAGTPLVEAMAPAARAAGNLAWSEAAQEIERAVRNGVSVASAMRRAGVFDATTIQMVRVGEESGTLEALLLQVADSDEQLVDAALSELARLLEPLIVLVLGVMIGGMVIAMYLPVFGLGQAI